MVALACFNPWPAPAQAQVTTPATGDGSAAGGAATAPLDGAAEVQQGRDYTFTVGMLVAVDDRRVTLAFEDGTTETYVLDRNTTIRSQNGDAESLADLEIGNMVLIITEEHATTAVTIVNSGGQEFHEAGPADIRGHDDPCGCLPEMPGSPASL